MKIKNIIFEDFINYKKPAMFIGMSKCNFKCDKECGEQVCQNSPLAASPNIEIDDIEIIQKFLNNPITEAIIFSGLEPFDTFEELSFFLGLFDDYYKRGHIHKKNKPDIVIYTGYYPEEIKLQLKRLSLLLENNWNIIIKFGRFIPNQKSHYDELLGVELASENQFSMKLEDILNDRFNHIR